MAIWYEKYRPKTLDEYVWRDAHHRAKIEEWLAQGSLPHLLFHGPSGTGKTSLALLLLKLLDIPPQDILEVNASGEARKADELERRIVAFSSTMAFGETEIKYVLLDEADALTRKSQDFLRAELGRYGGEMTRFILTCNYPAKILPPIQSRCQPFEFKSLLEHEYIARIGEILYAEGVSFDIATVLGYTKATYPNMRRCISLLEKNTVGHTLRVLETGEAEGIDYLVDAIKLWEEGKFLQARKLICAQADIEDYGQIYRFLYQNLALFGREQDRQDAALLSIRDAIVNHAVVADPEINLAACLCELTRHEPHSSTPPAAKG